MLRILLVIFGFAVFGISMPEDKIRIVHYEGQDIKTTYTIDRKFIGKYQGKKSGYLLLNEDGTGEYIYDHFGIAPKDCKPGVISLEWGFILDKNDRIVKVERDYGYSYPIMYKSTSEISFQGCSQTVFVDYVLEYKNGDLHISSSDDWVKKQ